LFERQQDGQILIADGGKLLRGAPPESSGIELMTGGAVLGSFLDDSTFMGT
jgi:hypothetical protein